MLAAQRRLDIARMVEQHGGIRVAVLSSTFGVTEETIRRDLEHLERDGRVEKTHGGAIARDILRFEASFSFRQARHPVEKKKIAGAVAQMIEDGDTVCLDASTTALFVAHELRHKRNLTVLTNSTRMTLEFAGSPLVTVISTGGTLRHASASLVGPLAERALRDYHVHKTVFSCGGFTLEHGFSDSNELEVEVKKLMMGCSQHAIAALDSTKFGREGFVNIAPAGAARTLVTDSGVPENIVRALRDAGVEVVIVQ
ncbi:MAG: DeoR/GlpR transcriptional regulator [Firmicutes bacterium]|nr:DeoR/GlpR transcriptional regulator [Bacillota bacterium]